MALSKMLTSFAAGELSPYLYARVDLDKYHVGAALLRNYFVDFRGGASSRPGLAFCGRAKGQNLSQVRLIPFVTSTMQAYVCEFGDHYVRFYYQGGQVLENAKNITGVTNANPCQITSAAHGFANGDEVYLSGIGGTTQLNGRNVLVAGATTNTFTITDLDGNNIDATAFGAYTAGGTVARVFTLVSPYAAGDLATLKYVQSASVLTLTHQSYKPQNLNQVSANSWSFADVVAGPAQDAPTNLTGSGAGGGYVTGYAVTAVSLDGKEESLPAIVVAGSGAWGSSTPTITIQWNAPNAPVSVYKIYKWQQQVNTQPIPTVFGYIAQTSSTSYTDTNITPDYTRNPPQFADPFSPGQVASIGVVSAGTGASGYIVPLTFTDSGGGTGAAGYAINSGGAIQSAVITNPGKNYTNNLIIAPASGSATFNYTLTPSSGTYPAVTSYAQQRRVFGGPINSPEKLVFSQTSNFNNFDTSLTTLSTDGITVSLASRYVNTIKALVPMSTGLVILTTGGAFLVSGGGPTAAITPSTVTAVPQASSGANDLAPIVPGYNILYVQNRGSIVRDLNFNYYLQSYVGTDRSQLANHLFFGKTLVDWTWSEEPFKIVWAVRSDGVLLSMTYVPEEEVFGWAHHDTQGLFKSVCSIPEGNRNATYVAVTRPINGVWKTYIERMSSRQWRYVDDAFCVDSGISWPLSFPSANLYPAATSGNGVTVVSDAAAFTAADVGSVIWLGGGNATIASYVSATQVTVNFLRPMLETLPDGVTPLPQQAGLWAKGTTTNVVSGLWHLIGQTVSVLADGLAFTGLVVDNGGNVTLPNGYTASKISVGIGFTSQLQTLQVDLGEPTQQGKRKTIPAVTVRVADTRGLWAGPDFNSLTELVDPTFPQQVPPPLYTGDERVIIYSDWKTAGQVCIQQTAPLPSTILGLIPEIVSGDTGR